MVSAALIQLDITVFNSNFPVYSFYSWVKLISKEVNIFKYLSLFPSIQALEIWQMGSMMNWAKALVNNFPYSFY